MLTTNIDNNGPQARQVGTDLGDGAADTGTHLELRPEELRADLIATALRAFLQELGWWVLVNVPCVEIDEEILLFDADGKWRLYTHYSKSPRPSVTQPV